MITCPFSGTLINHSSFPGIIHTYANSVFKQAKKKKKKGLKNLRVWLLWMGSTTSVPVQMGITWLINKMGMDG